MFLHRSIALSLRRPPGRPALALLLSAAAACASIELWISFLKRSNVSSTFADVGFVPPDSTFPSRAVDKTPEGSFDVTDTPTGVSSGVANTDLFLIDFWPELPLDSKVDFFPNPTIADNFA